MQRSELEAEISRILGDPNQTRWTTTVIDARLDAAEVDVLKWTNCIKTALSYSLIATNQTIAINSKTIDILDGTFTLSDGTVKSRGHGFDPISRWDLDFNRPNWRNESAGEPELWFFHASLNYVYLIPAPDSAHAVNCSVNFLAVVTPTTPISQGAATDIPFDNNQQMVPYNRALIYWVVSECLKDNNDTDSLNKARYFRSDNLQEPGEYEKEIKQILMKFDVAEAVPAGVKYQPQGGRISGGGMNQKSNPLGWGLW